MNRPVNRKKKLEEQLETIFTDLKSEKSVSELLLKNLSGTLHCKFTDSKSSYVISFGKDSFEVLKFDEYAAKSESDDQDSTDEGITSTISSTRDVFIQMTSGKLNPQIAMLSHKVEIEGNTKIAMYFFNLFN